MKGKRVQVHFERVRNELERYRDGGGGESPRFANSKSLDFEFRVIFFPPAPLGVLFSEFPTN